MTRLSWIIGLSCKQRLPKGVAPSGQGNNCRLNRYIVKLRYIHRFKQAPDISHAYYFSGDLKLLFFLSPMQDYATHPVSLVNS